LARLASQFANGAGNFSDIVFISIWYYRPDRLARSTRGANFARQLTLQYQMKSLPGI